MQNAESFRASGKIHQIGETQNLKDTFRKRDLVLEYYDHPTFRNYPQYIKFEATQERCVILDQFRPGEEVLVEFGLRGREWVNPKGERVYFNTLNVLNIVPLHASGPGQPPPLPPDLAADPLNELPEDDLPF